MRIMAIDYGDAHTGIAISDLTGMLAGYTTVINTRKQELVLDGIAALIEDKTRSQTPLKTPPQAQSAPTAHSKSPKYPPKASKALAPRRWKQ